MTKSIFFLKHYGSSRSEQLHAGPRNNFEKLKSEAFLKIKFANVLFHRNEMKIHVFYEKMDSR